MARLLLVAGLAWLLLSQGKGCDAVSVPGVRQIVIVHEAQEQTPEFSRMATALRVGPPGEYLKSKGHSLLILDDDAVDADGKPSPLLAPFRPLNPPELIIVQPPTKVLYRGKLIDDANAVVDEVKRHGG